MELATPGSAVRLISVADTLPTALRGLVSHSSCEHLFSIRVENSLDPDCYKSQVIWIYGVFKEE